VLKPIVAQKLVNGLIWMVCGALVIAIRVLIFPSSYVFVSELVGVAMIVYGAAKLLWVLARRLPAEASSL